MSGALVNDVHSRLNETAVEGVVPVGSLESIGAALLKAKAAGTPVSIAGGRHAMGGQQFVSGGVVLDTRPLDGVLSLDLERGLVEVEAGIRWPALIDALADTPWAIRQKQTGADDLCAGGAVSANVHGAVSRSRPSSATSSGSARCSCTRTRARRAGSSSRPWHVSWVASLGRASSRSHPSCRACARAR